MVQLNGDANLFLQVQDGKVYYAEKVLDGDYPNLDFDGFGYTARLSSYDLKTRKKTEIMKTEFKDFLVLPDGDILYTRVRGDGTGSELWSYQQGEQRLLGEVNELIGSLPIMMTVL